MWSTPLDLCILINLIFIIGDVVRSKESLCKFQFPLNQSKLRLTAQCWEGLNIELLCQQCCYHQ